MLFVGISALQTMLSSPSQIQLQFAFEINIDHITKAEQVIEIEDGSVLTLLVSAALVVLVAVTFQLTV